MIFLILVLIIYLITITQLKYKSKFLVLGIIFLTFFITSIILIYYKTENSIQFFYYRIGYMEFYHLIGIWYCADIVCSALIIKRYREYLKINRK